MRSSDPLSSQYAKAITPAAISGIAVKVPLREKNPGRVRSTLPEIKHAAPSNSGVLFPCLACNEVAIGSLTQLFRVPTMRFNHRVNGMAKTDFRSVDEYVETFPKDVQATLETIRRTIQKAVPEAEEVISYQMPAFKFHGSVLLYFSAFKNHYSIFGATQGVRKAFKNELSRHEGTKGTLRFPLDEPVPVKLIRDIAMYGTKENLERETKKTSRVPRGEFRVSSEAVGQGSREGPGQR